MFYSNNNYMQDLYAYNQIPLNNTYSFVKVLWTQSGKYDASQITMICLGLSLSYVLTCLIMGF